MNTLEINLVILHHKMAVAVAEVVREQDTDVSRWFLQGLYVNWYRLDLPVKNSHVVL